MPTNEILEASIVKKEIKSAKGNTKGMPMLKKPQSTFVPWSNEEITEFLKVAEQEGDGVMYEFTLSTGVRLGELLALSWDEIDLDKQTVTIKKNVTPIGSGKEQIEQIRSGFRIITLQSNLIAKLKKHREKQKSKGEMDEQYNNELNLVFPNNKGKIQESSVVRKKFYRLIDKANVRKVKFHDLRRMHAILLIKAGVSYEIIKGRLGHKKIRTTIKGLNPHCL